MAVPSDCVSAVDHVALAACDGAEVVVAKLSQYGTPSHQRDGFFILAAALEIPVLDMAIAHRHKVVAIVAERHGHDFRAHFVRGDLQVGLPVEDVDNVVVLRANGHEILAGWGESLREKHDKSNRDPDKGMCVVITYNAVDCILVTAEFRDNGTAAIALVARRQVQFPDLDRRIYATLAGRQVSAALRVRNGRDCLARCVQQIRLAELLRVEQHDGASVMDDSS